MRIRLNGTIDEVRRAADLIATMLDIRSISQLYPNRPPSRLCRLYLDTGDPPERTLASRHPPRAGGHPSP